MCQDEAHIELNIVFMKKGFLTILTFASVCIFNASASAANLTLYTDYNAWLAAVNASSQNLETSTFETNYTNVSNEEYISPFSQLPATSDPDYLTTRTDISFDGNNVNLGRHATFRTDTTGFDISFEISATQSVSGRGDARIYYNDILQGKTPVQVDSFTDVLSIGKFNGFDSGDGSEFDWDDDDFTLEITSNDQVYGIAFDLHNNKQNVSEWLEIYANKTDTQSLVKFDQGTIPGYTGSYDSNFDDVRFIGVVSDTPFTWLEFNEGSGVNDIGLSNIRFATPQPQQTFRLLINSAGTGSGPFSISPSGTDCSSGSTICMDYASATSVSITASPSAGDELDSWSGCASSSGQTCNVTMSQDRNITASFINDADSDGIPDQSDNCPTTSNPNQTNTDGDSAGNLCDDFPNNANETKDSDNDGMGDNFESTFGLNAANGSDATQDLDNDGLTNLQEFEGGSDPSNINDPQNFAAVFWRNTATGSNTINLMDGSEIILSTSLNNVGVQWQIVGSGDFDNDGEKDFLWRDSLTGENRIYFMNGSQVTQDVQINTVSTDWEVAGITDFNGDNKDDVLWRDKVSGRVWMYLMNGATVTSSLHVAFTGLDWEIDGVGDFDGDGKGDILWRNKLYGRVWMYLMSGAIIQTSSHVAHSGNDWDIKEIGDFNGDDKEDIFWRNNITGENWIYLMNGTQISQNSQLNTVADLNWKVVQTDDFNRDGKTDLLWRNAITGENSMYQLNGISIISNQSVDQVPDTNWHVVPDYD